MRKAREDEGNRGENGRLAPWGVTTCGGVTTFARVANPQASSPQALTVIVTFEWPAAAWM